MATNLFAPTQNSAVASREADARSVDMREHDTRTETYTYVPPSSLPEPDQRPGWKHRWVRMSMLNSADDQNVWRQRREGWEPCKLADYPEYHGMASQMRTEDVIEIGGLLLCRMPEERLKARAKYYEEMNKKAMSSIDSSLMREQDSRMPLIIERKSKVSFGSGE